MKYLCLAYGAEKDWKELSTQVQQELLAQDDVIRSRGNPVAAVRQDVTTVKAWDGTPEISNETYANPDVPLAGFAIIEAPDIDAVIELVKDTPCARAKGAIEIRALWFGDGG